MALVSEAMDEPQIHGDGTTEEAWERCEWLWQRPVSALDELLGGARRLLVVAPHPDDEVLACGGLMALASAAGLAVEVLAVTDGEACYPGEAWWTPERLVQARRIELRNALDALGLAASPIHHAGIADGGVAAGVHALRAWLQERCGQGDLLLVPWRHDGHPDHEAAAIAALSAAEMCGASVLEYPVWAWHWLQPEALQSMWEAPRLLDIHPVHAAKQQAIACFRTQTGAVPDLHADPILPPHVLQRFARPYEVFLA